MQWRWSLVAILKGFAIKYFLRGYLKVSFKLQVYLRQSKDTSIPFLRRVSSKVGEVAFTWLQYFAVYLLFPQILKKASSV